VVRVTADSNIYISALMFGGKPLEILETALEGESELAISDDILSETLRVLRDKFHRTSEQLQEIETFIGAITRQVYPAERIDAVPTDRDDNRVLECAVTAGSEVIVSGDADLLGLREFRGIRIQRVSEFLSAFQSRSR
jgi:putative PIN family toxin of toxin-antitoxin system